MQNIYFDQQCYSLFQSTFFYAINKPPRIVKSPSVYTPSKNPFRRCTCIILGLKRQFMVRDCHDGQKWVFFLPRGSLETHRWLWNVPNETKLGRNMVKESPHVLMVVLYFWLTAWRHKRRWNMALKFGINYLVQMTL